MRSRLAQSGFIMAQCPRCARFRRRSPEALPPPALAWLMEGFGLFITSPSEGEGEDGPWTRLMPHAHADVVYLLPDNVDNPTNVEELRREVRRMFPQRERRTLVALNPQRHTPEFIAAAIAYRAEVVHQNNNEDE
jgi:hypothetical protein